MAARVADHERGRQPQRGVAPRQRPSVEPSHRALAPPEGPGHGLPDAGQGLPRTPAEDQELETDYVVAPGAAPGSIGLRFTGAQVALVDNTTGELVLGTEAGEVRHAAPVAFQVVEGQRYSTMAEENRISARLMAPPRGRILDRHGEVVAGNRLNWRALLVTEQSANPAMTLENFARLVPLP